MSIRPAPSCPRPHFSRMVGAVSGLLLAALVDAGTAHAAPLQPPPAAPPPALQPKEMELGHGTAALPPPAGSDTTKALQRAGAGPLQVPPRPATAPAQRLPAVPGAAGTAAAPIAPAELPKKLQQILAGTAFAHGRVGVEVVRLDNAATLYSQDAGQQLVPASNVKLVTTAAALDSLSPDFRFQTELYGQLDAQGTVRGNLTVKGYGDPYLVPERLAYLATRLYVRGVRRIDGKLAIDDSFFQPNVSMALGWQEDRSARAYMAPAAAFSAGFNAMMVHVVPPAQGPEAPTTAEILLDPPNAYAHISGQVNLVSKGPSRVSVDVRPQGSTASVVRVAGQLVAGEPTRSYWRRIDAPAYFAGALLVKALRDAGIAVADEVVRAPVPEDAPLLYVFASPRLAELLVPLNKFSNNFMAMQLALVLGAYHHGAPATWPKAKRALQAFLQNKVGIAPDSYALHNASGLHGLNTLSAHQLVALLRYAHAQPSYRTEFVNSLATAAGSGTLQDRMQDGPAALHVRAKTGTLMQASALSGYVDTPGGVPLAFSLLVNGYRHIEDVWQAQDAFAAVLARLVLTPTTEVPRGNG